MVELGHPILGDRNHTPFDLREPADFTNGMWLWSVALTFEHPATGQAMQLALQEPELLREWRERAGVDAIPDPWEPLKGEPAARCEPVRRLSRTSLGKLDDALDSDPASTHSTCASFKPGDGGVVFTVRTEKGGVDPGTATGSTLAAANFGRLEVIKGLEEALGRCAPLPPAPCFVPCLNLDSQVLKCINVGEAPSTLVFRMLQARLKQRLCQERVASSCVCQIVPLDGTCAPCVEGFKQLVQQFVIPHFQEDRPLTWAIHFNAKGSSGLTKSVVLDILGEAIMASNALHRVDLANPEKCVVVESRELFCGVSVVKSWAALRRYNLYRVLQD